MIVRSFFAAALIVAAFSIPFSTPASAQCPKFPDVEIWGDISHHSVASYVNRKFDGDWDVYAARLAKIVVRLQELHRKGKAAIVKMKGQRARFNGETLAQYLRDSETRIDIIHCLGDEAHMQAPDRAPETAATPAAAANGTVKTVQVDDSAALSASGDDEIYRMYLSMPADLVARLRQRAVHQSLIEKRQVSVNDIILALLNRDLK